MGEDLGDHGRVVDLRDDAAPPTARAGEHDRAARAHRELQTAAAADAAKRLAQRVTAQTRELLAYADEMGSAASRERHPARLLPAPVLADRGPDAARFARP